MAPGIPQNVQTRRSRSLSQYSRLQRWGRVRGAGPCLGPHSSVSTLQGITVRSAALLPPKRAAGFDHSDNKVTLRNALPQGASRTKDPSWEVRLAAGPGHNWEERSTSSRQTYHLSRAQWGLWLFLNCPLFLPAPDLV